MRGFELTLTSTKLSMMLVTSPLSLRGGKILTLTLSFVILRIEPILVKKVGAVGWV